MDITSLLAPLVNVVPSALGAIVFVILAIIIAKVAKKLVAKGVSKLNLVKHLSKWNLVKPDHNEKALVETISQAVYFIVILFFLPAILSRLGVSSTIDPISGMFSKFFAFIPNVVAAGFILFVGSLFCKFLKNLVKGLLAGLNLDKWLEKLFPQEEKSGFDGNKLADVLSSIVYVLVFIPILTLALETLNITSLSQPIVSLLNQVVSFVPNLIVAVVLLTVGGFLAKLLGNVVEKLLQTSGIDNYSKFLSFDGKPEYTLSAVLTNLLRGLILVFFFVEAISALKLVVLNSIGTAVIAYLPAVISSLVILALAVIGGNVLSGFIQSATKNAFLAALVRYGLLGLAIFMALDQLNIAQTIVQSTFTMVLGAVAVAFALAFGLGGRDFASKQLEKLDKTINKDK